MGLWKVSECGGQDVTLLGWTLSPVISQLCVLGSVPSPCLICSLVGCLKIPAILQVNSTQFLAQQTTLFFFPWRCYFETQETCNQGRALRAVAESEPMNQDDTNETQISSPRGQHFPNRILTKDLSFSSVTAIPALIVSWHLVSIHL